MEEESTSENQCAICSEEFQNINDLQVHLLLSCKPQKKRFSAKTKEKLNKKFGIIETSKGKFYPCHTCTKVFRFASARSTHIKRVHERNRPHKCDTCGSAFYKPNELAAHMRTHTGEKPFSCHLCDRNFSLINTLKRHVERHLKAKKKPAEVNVVFLENDQKRFKCAVCSLLFTRNPNLTRHMRLHTGQKPYECNRCGYSSPVKTTLEKHIRCIHSSQLELYRCRFCKKRCSNDRTLRLHLRNHGEDLYICSACSYSTFSKENFGKHEKTHGGVIGGTGNVEGAKAKLSVHKPSGTKKGKVRNRMKMRSHSSASVLPSNTLEESKACSLCMKQFDDCESLWAHLAEHHVKTEQSIGDAAGFREDNGINTSSEKQGIQSVDNAQNKLVIKMEKDILCRCELCPSPQYFTGSDDLEAHLISFHIESEDGLDESRSCGTVDQESGHERSGQNVSQDDKLRKSELITDEIGAERAEKRYRCQFCGKIYARSDHLGLHLRTNHGDPHNCELCSYSTVRRDNLNRHKETTHWIVKRGEKVTPPMFRFILDGKRLFAKALHAGAEGTRHYCCKKCSCNFNSDEELCVHYSRYHKLPAVAIRNLK